MFIKTKKGLELPMWALILFVLAIVILLLFYLFISGGFSRLGIVSEIFFKNLRGAE
jgi:uncharacterized ion transporter superfamily protein YfcC